MDPNSLLNSYCICKSNLINKTDNLGWKFVSTFHLKEFEDINNFHAYRNIFYIKYKNQNSKTQDFKKTKLKS